MNINKSDFRQLAGKSNVTNYAPYSTYSFDTTAYDMNTINQGLDTNIVGIYQSQYNLFNGTKEGFDNHGFIPSTQVNQNSANTPSSAGLISDISKNQITPMIAIAQDYSGKLSDISNNYVSLKNNISGITNSRGTGVRDYLLANDSKYDYASFNLNKPVGMKRKLLNVNHQTIWGWKSKTSLDDGINLTAQYYKELSNVF
jgi:hypothetical protein